MHSRIFKCQVSKELKKKLVSIEGEYTVKGLFNFLRQLLLGPETPSLQEYLAALNAAPLVKRTDFDKVIFDPSEVRWHNNLISVIYYQSEYAETVDLYIYGRHGGLVITLKEFKVIKITKDGLTRKNPQFSPKDKLTASQIAHKVRMDVTR